MYVVEYFAHELLIKLLFFQLIKAHHESLQWQFVLTPTAKCPNYDVECQKFFLRFNKYIQIMKGSKILDNFMIENIRFK